MTRARATVCLVLALIVGSPARADVEHPEPLSAFPQSLLAVRTAAGSVINFKIWNADNPGREEQGLMYIREMDDHAGMLFVFPESQRISMWMKNTYLSLDLVFIESGGRIGYIAKRATPLSLDIISPPQPARGVLELKGGVTDLLGIRVGDQVIERSFHNAR